MSNISDSLSGKMPDSTRDSQLMNQAAEEIIQLRGANAIMRGKLEMFDKIMGLIDTVAPKSRGMSETGMIDTVRQLKERATVLNVIENMQPGMDSERIVGQSKPLPINK